MAEKKGVKKPVKKVVERRRHELVKVTVPYTDDIVLKAGKKRYLAEPFVAQAVSATKDTGLTHRYRMAFNRGKYNTIDAFGIKFIDLEDPQVPSCSVHLICKEKAAKQAKEPKQKAVKASQTEDGGAL